MKKVIVSSALAILVLGGVTVAMKDNTAPQKDDSASVLQTEESTTTPEPEKKVSPEPQVAPEVLTEEAPADSCPEDKATALAPFQDKVSKAQDLYDRADEIAKNQWPVGNPDVLRAHLKPQLDEAKKDLEQESAKFDC